MELIEYLRDRGLENLCHQYHIKANRHHQYPNLVCLKYSQIESPMEEKIVQQSRGIILDEEKDWEIVSYSYNKFFNYGEPNAVEIDWNHATVYDKLDGSLMVLYYYDDQWRVQSSGTPDATGKVNGFPFTFAKLFWQVWQELGYTLPKETEYCFSFELMTPYNRIVVKQESNQLTLHGVRNVKTLGEEEPKIWTDRYGWELVKTYPLGSWSEILEASKYLDPMNSEGYVICDRAFRRVKVKSPEYVALSHFRQGFSTRRMLEIILKHEGDEFLSYYPEWTEMYHNIQQKYDDFANKIEAEYNRYKDIPSQKDFALSIKHLPYSGILFALRSGKSASIRESLQKTSLPKVEQLLEIENIYLGV
ncbi:RNA ligase [Spirulina sp. 06S082]|uniref:RNA ligase n=1 Tax=Spirulina sp. 06S082 TaxID=3110248 RepID=UPI002B2165A8|nr:RNA ligase [Spirulina sp. 06S082]MEA5472239.1 RNA ligase [Spirulina sp. 06S082]